MKYITKEIWAGWNSRDEKIRQKSFQESERGFKIYEEQLGALRPKLGEDNFNFF